MDTLEEKRARLLDCPVIAAVKDEAGLEQALRSECEVVFLLFGTIVSVSSLVEKVRRSGKLAIVHIDLVEGLASREVAVDACKACAARTASFPHGLPSSAGPGIWAC